MLFARSAAAAAPRCQFPVCRMYEYISSSRATPLAHTATQRLPPHFASSSLPSITTQASFPAFPLCSYRCGSMVVTNLSTERRLAISCFDKRYSFSSPAADASTVGNTAHCWARSLLLRCNIRSSTCCLPCRRVLSARLTLHSTKLCTKFKIFRKKYFLVLRLTLRHF
jgi:hypothetical protein